MYFIPVNLRIFAISALSFALLFVAAQGAYAAQGKQKDYNRPYGNPVNNDYQQDYYKKKKVENESLFYKDLHEDEKPSFQDKPSFDENQSYMVPPNKKTIPTWGAR